MKQEKSRDFSNKNSFSGIIMNRKYDVIIVGSGVTGIGIARDLAMRGAKVLLLERYDLASGATGRSHGLLHSGDKYVVKDPESAAERARENKISERVQGHRSSAQRIDLQRNFRNGAKFKPNN